MTGKALLFLALLALGAGWGMTIPLAKIAVSTGHQPYGLIFWQLVIVVAVLWPIARIWGRPVAIRPRHLRLFAIIALTGAVLPDFFFYLTAAKLPGGVMSILMSSSPLFALPVALAFGNDNFSWLRMAGLVFGMLGILLMIGPKTSLPDPAMTVFVLLALLAPALYATEANIVARWGTMDLDPVQTIVGASAVGTVISLPLALATDQWVDPFASFGAPEAALAAGAAIHGVVYAGYVWLVGRAGSVFASQAAYIVTAFGVIWSILLLGEVYSSYVWAALVLMLFGIFLVQPRPSIRLAPVAAMGKGSAQHGGENLE